MYVLLSFPFLQKNSETFSMTLSQINGSLFAIMVSHYFQKCREGIIQKYRITYDSENSQGFLGTPVSYSGTLKILSRICKH